MAGGPAADQNAAINIPQRNCPVLKLAQVGDKPAALLHRKDVHNVAARLWMELPSGQVLAVEELHPALVVLVIRSRLRPQGRQQREAEQENGQTHESLFHVGHSWSMVLATILPSWSHEYVRLLFLGRRFG